MRRAVRETFHQPRSHPVTALEVLGLYINEVPTLALKYPLLQIARVAEKVTLPWSAIFPDYKLHETPDLGTPFTPSVRGIITQDGFRSTWR